MTRPTASARANSPFGFKAVVVFNGRTKIPVRHNFKTREEAIAYAEKYIVANYDRPATPHKAPVRIHPRGA
jgi:hypothetical protein